jgi:archaellum component FlaG (FlaF/FlaG flagellin family)
MEKKVIIITTIVTILILVVAVVWMSSTNTNAAQVSTSQNAKAYTLDATSADWGQIPMYKGNVTKVFNIKNTGTDTLKLFNIKTSCHCTRAFVTINGIDGPDFGMSGISDWIGEVTPGKQAKLSVVFDPAYHGPTGTGPITRYVSVQTNDKANPTLTFTVTGTVFK